MSYILDALRKSEQQRQLAETPTLYTAQIAVDAEGAQPRLLYAALAILLIGCGMLIGWWRPWQHAEGTGAPPSTPRAINQPAPPPSTVPPPSAAPQPEPPSPRKFVPLPPVRAVMSTTPPLRMGDPERDGDDEHPRTPVSIPPALRPGAHMPATAVATPGALPPSLQPAVQPPPAAPVTTSVPTKVEATVESNASSPGQEQKIISLEDLPADIQQEIPRMSISGFSYSEEPRERIVGINDRLLQEGQYLVQGLKLEQISRDGLIFSYKNFRFRKSLQ